MTDCPLYRYGRKMALLGSMMVSSVASLAGAFMPDYWSYLALRSGNHPPSFTAEFLEHSPGSLEHNCCQCLQCFFILWTLWLHKCLNCVPYKSHGISK